MFNVIQIGCGGTGSWLVDLLSKFINNLQERNINCLYTLCDFDNVEERNCIRQNFNKSEVGMLKVCALSLSNIQNIKDINLVTTKITKQKLELLLNIDYLNIIIGCVDNNSTRNQIYSCLTSNPYKYLYIDSGNQLSTGQIISIWDNIEDYVDQYRPAVYNNIQAILKQKEETINNQSCAFFGEQSQGINNLAAALLFNIIQNFIINKKLPSNLIIFNIDNQCTLI